VRTLLLLMSVAAVTACAVAQPKVCVESPQGTSGSAPAVIVACERLDEPFGRKSGTFASDLAGRGYLVDVVEVGKGPFETAEAVAGLVATVSQAVTRVVADKRADPAT